MAALRSSSSWTPIKLLYMSNNYMKLSLAGSLGEQGRCEALSLLIQQVMERAREEASESERERERMNRVSLFSVGVQHEPREGAVLVVVAAVGLATVQLDVDLVAGLQVQHYAVAGVVVVLVGVLRDGAGSHLRETEEVGGTHTQGTSLGTAAPSDDDDDDTPFKS